MVNDNQSTPVIISVAITGSFPTKEMNEAVPYTPQEIIDSAVESWNAGASIAHIHVRDPETGAPSYKFEYFEEILNGIRARCDMLVNLTTSGLRLEGPDVIKQRLRNAELHPDFCSFDLGSMNFRDWVFINSPEWVDAAVSCFREQNVKPEIEVFDVGHIYQAIDLIERGLIADPPFFQLCMGIKWGIEATVENLVFMKSKLPDNAIWSVLGSAASQLPMNVMGLLMGGNVRVGFEDNIYLRKGVKAKSNAQFVERIARVTRELGREVATPADTRTILKMHNK
jgi:3-keto-5-aminohexanoate cleavage enzyme